MTVADGVWQQIFRFDNYGELLVLVRNGALLVLSLVVTPAAAAARVTASPVLLPALSVLFAVLSIEGGILLALGGSIPISPYVTTVSFTIYVVCRLAGKRRLRRWGARGTALVA